MQTKSKIQLEVEAIKLRQNFKEGLTNLMEKYNIEDAVLTLCNNEVMEVTKGYFVSEHEYDTLDEAMHVYDPSKNTIRVMENETFQVGTTYKLLSECPEDSEIFDVDRLAYIKSR